LDQPRASSLSVTICGVAELDLHRDAGFGHVLSILDPDFPVPGSFEAYAAHHRLDLRFHDIIDEVPGGIYRAPSREDVETLLRFGRETVEQGAARVLVHCHMGISRSTAASILLIAQTEPARRESDIMGEIIRVRPRAWPNLRMIELGDELLGREGRLVEAVRDRYRRALARNPELIEFIHETGRHREIAGL
jgi:predicted protein tyrosine phosphatase